MSRGPVGLCSGLSFLVHLSSLQPWRTVPSPVEGQCADLPELSYTCLIQFYLPLFSFQSTLNETLHPDLSWNNIRSNPLTKPLSSSSYTFISMKDDLTQLPRSTKHSWRTCSCFCGSVTPHSPAVSYCLAPFLGFEILVLLQLSTIPILSSPYTVPSEEHFHLLSTHGFHCYLYTGCQPLSKINF